MTSIQIGFSGIVILFALIALRIPIGVALITVSFGGLWFLTNFDVAWGTLGTMPYQFAANWVLSSVPMFLLLGYLSYHCRLTEGLFAAVRCWFSNVPGGLAIAAIFGSAGFAAVSGSSVACSAAMGRIAVPEMIRYRYDPELATATVSAAGTIGALIPPSIIMILFGIIAQVPVSELFLGGISVGLLTAFGYIVVVLVRVKLNPALAPKIESKVSLSERLYALQDTWPVILIMVGIFTGLFGGFFTPTEAGAVGAFLALLVAAFKGTLTWARFRMAILETLSTTGALIIIAVGAGLLTRFLAISGAGNYLSDLVIDSTSSVVVVLFALVLVYLVLGMFLDPIGAMLLTLPIVLPIVNDFGLNLIWFGVLLTKLLEVGMITPPIGMNVFVIKSVVGNLVTTGAIFRGVLWFLVMDIVVIAFLIIWPGFVLFLPNLLD
jgi:tripartite ATP-independent transporter DctM subunit